MEIKQFNESFYSKPYSDSSRPSKRFKYQKISIKLDELKKTPISSVLTKAQSGRLNSDKENICLFHETLQDWTNRDISDKFQDLSKSISSLAFSIPSIVYNLDEIVSKLLYYSEDALEELSKSITKTRITDIINIKPCLLLLKILSKEVGKLLGPHLLNIFGTLVKVIEVNPRDNETVISIIETFQSLLSDNSAILTLSELFNCFKSLIYSYHDYINHKTSQILSPSLRRFDVNETLTLLQYNSNVTDKTAKQVNYDQCSTIIFTNMILIFNQKLHSSGMRVLTALLRSKIDNTNLSLIVDKIFLKLNLEEQIIFFKLFIGKKVQRKRLEVISTLFSTYIPLKNEALNAIKDIFFSDLVILRDLKLLIYFKITKNYLKGNKSGYCKILESILILFLSSKPKKEEFNTILFELTTICISVETESKAQSLSQEFKYKILDALIKSTKDYIVVLEFISVLGVLPSSTLSKKGWFHKKINQILKKKYLSNLSLSCKEMKLILVYFCISKERKLMKYLLSENQRDIKFVVLYFTTILNHSSPLDRKSAVISDINDEILSSLVRLFYENVNDSEYTRLFTNLSRIINFTTRKISSFEAKDKETNDLTDLLLTKNSKKRYDILLFLRNVVFRTDSKDSQICHLIAKLLNLEDIAIDFSTERDKFLKLNELILFVKGLLNTTSDSESHPELVRNEKLIRIFFNSILSQLFIPYDPYADKVIESLSKLLSAKSFRFKDLFKEIFLPFVEALHTNSFSQDQECIERNNNNLYVFNKVVILFKYATESSFFSRKIFFQFMRFQYISRISDSQQHILNLLKLREYEIELSPFRTNRDIKEKLNSVLNLLIISKPSSVKNTTIDEEDVNTIVKYLLSHANDVNIQQLCVKFLTSIKQNSHVNKENMMKLCDRDVGVVSHTLLTLTSSSAHAADLEEKGISAEEEMVINIVVCRYIYILKNKESSIFINLFTYLSLCSATIISFFIGYILKVNNSSVRFKFLKYTLINLKYKLNERLYHKIFCFVANKRSITADDCDKVYKEKDLVLFNLIFKNNYYQQDTNLKNCILHKIAIDKKDLKGGKDMGNRIKCLEIIKTLIEVEKLKIMFTLKERKYIFSNFLKYDINLIRTYLHLFIKTEMLNIKMGNKFMKYIISQNMKLIKITDIDLLSCVFNEEETQIEIQQESDVKRYLEIVYILLNRSVFNYKALLNSDGNHLIDLSKDVKIYFNAIKAIIDNLKLSSSIKKYIFYNTITYLSSFAEDDETQEKHGLDGYMNRLIEVDEIDNILKIESTKLLTKLEDVLSPKILKFIQNLSSMSKNNLNEVNLTLRLSTYKEISSLLASSSFSLYELKIIFKIIRNDLFSPEYILRNVSLDFVTQLITELSFTAHFSVFKDVLKTVKFGLKYVDQQIKQSFIKLLRTILIKTKHQENQESIGTLPGEEFVELLNENNTDEDLLLNLAHIQQHRVSKSFVRIKNFTAVDINSSSSCSLSLPTVNDLLLPLIFNSLCLKIRKKDAQLFMNSKLLFVHLMNNIVTEEKFLKILQSLIDLFNYEKNKKTRTKLKVNYDFLNRMNQTTTHQVIRKRLLKLIYSVTQRFILIVSQCGDQVSSNEDGEKSKNWQVLLLEKVMNIFEKTMREDKRVFEIYLRLLLTVSDKVVASDIKKVKVNKIIKQIAQNLRDRDFVLRDNARKLYITLIQKYYTLKVVPNQEGKALNVRETLGLNLINESLRDFKTFFIEGFQRHVLFYSTTYLILQLKRFLNENIETEMLVVDLCNSLRTILSILFNESISQEKDSHEDYKSKLNNFKEYKIDNRLKAFKALGELVVIEELGRETKSIKFVEIMMSKVRHEFERQVEIKEVHKVRDSLIAFTKGLTENAFLHRPDLFNSFLNYYVLPNLTNICRLFSSSDVTLENKKDGRVTVWRVSEFLKNEQVSKEHVVEKVPQLTGYNRYSNVKLRSKVCRDIFKSSFLAHYMFLAKHMINLSKKYALDIDYERIRSLLRSIDVNESSLISVYFKTLSLIHGLSPLSTSNQTDNREKVDLNLCFRYLRKEENVEILKYLNKILLSSQVTKKDLSENDLDLIYSIVIKFYLKEQENYQEVIIKLTYTLFNKFTFHKENEKLVEEEKDMIDVYEILNLVSNLLYSASTSSNRKSFRNIIYFYFSQTDSDPEFETKLLNKLTANLNYSSKEGRLSGLLLLEMLLDVKNDNKFKNMIFSNDLKNFLTFFITLCLRLNNEVRSTVKQKVNHIILIFIKNCKVFHFDEIKKLLNTWYVSPKLELKILALNLISIIFNLEKYHKNNDMLKMLVDALVVKNDETEDFWKVKYLSLVALNKLNNFSKLKNIVDIKILEELCRNNHFWLRKQSVLLYTKLMQSNIFKFSSESVEDILCFVISCDHVDEEYILTIFKLASKLLGKSQNIGKFAEICCYLVKRNESELQRKNRKLVLSHILQFYLHLTTCENQITISKVERDITLSIIESIVYLKKKEDDKDNEVFECIEKIESNLIGFLGKDNFMAQYAEVETKIKDRKKKRKLKSSKAKVLVGHSKKIKVDS